MCIRFCWVSSWVPAEEAEPSGRPGRGLRHGTPDALQWIPWTSMHGFLCMPWISYVFHEFLWISMYSMDFRTFMDFNWCHRFHGFPWEILNFLVDSTYFHGFSWILWVPIEFYGITRISRPFSDCNGFPRISMDFNRFQRMPIDFCISMKIIKTKKSRSRRKPAAS